MVSLSYEIIDQLIKGALSLFMCPKRTGTSVQGGSPHGVDNLLALRLHAREVKPEVWDYECPVPVFGSGAEAREHGKAEIEAPSEQAGRVIQRLVRKRDVSPRDILS